MHSMKFVVSGRVTEQESSLGVSGLMVRAYDKDLLFDDLLGTAITDADGYFELRYSDSDFRELFDFKPDIYLSIYAPPCRFLMDTRDAIRWNAGREESFEISLSRDVLGDSAPTRPDNQVEAEIALPKSSLKIEKRGVFDVPRLSGFVTTGLPGAPALPCQTRYVALPLGGDVLEFQVIPGKAVRLDGPYNAFPAQAPFPDRGIPIENVRFQMTPPDPRFFEAQALYPESLAELVRVEQVGPLQLAMVQVRPLQYDPVARNYLFYPNIKYVVTYDRDKAKSLAEIRRASGAKVGELQAEYLNDFLQIDRVAVAKDIYWPHNVQLEDIPHLIITDNYAWPESIPRGDGDYTTRAPTTDEYDEDLAEDLVVEFQRLADWRTSIGFRSRVVTISQILDGTYGDFTENGFARDLPEVIRNFLKHAQAHSGTRYVVLGGDVTIVPMRRLIGMGPNIIDVGFGVMRTTNNPPHKYECCFLKGHGVSKLHPDPNYCRPKGTDVLSTHHGGVRISYNREAGPGNLGWYFTTESDFNRADLYEGFTRLPYTQPTEFIIVEGPEAIIDDDFYWVLDGNSIPSDFYYASLIGPDYSVPGKHDFDANNNLLYGQTHRYSLSEPEVTLDQVAMHSDLWVGRVPAKTAVDVQTFVNKLITYEDLKSPTTPFAHVDTNYFRKVLYVADYYVRYFQYFQSNVSSPDEGEFSHISVESGIETRIRTKFDMTQVQGIPSFRLVAVKSTSQTIVPYNSDANVANPGWLFTTDDLYVTQSANPTRFIKVIGYEGDVFADYFFWDPIGLELVTEEKEHLRGLMNANFPSFDNVERHYSDYFDLSAPPPLTPLAADTLVDAINSGPHFLSLSGHGGPYGCCRINSHDSFWHFMNGPQYFIAFANSCLTARPDGVDSLGEVSVLNPDGGAVAYVGFSRMGFCGVGDNFEEVFWYQLRNGGPIGPAAGLRVATDGVSDMWTSYALTLYGDPAMRVWNKVPMTLEVEHPEIYEAHVPVIVRMCGKPLRDVRVTLSWGRGDESVFLSKKTNTEGCVSFALPPNAGRLAMLQVTVSSRDGRLYRGIIRNGIGI